MTSRGDMRRDFRSVSSLVAASYQPPGTASVLKASTNGGGLQQVPIGEIAHRTGTVLDPTTLLKVDDYQQKGQGRSHPVWFSRRISGAEQLRLIEGTSILGVAQPSLPGIRGILDALGTGRIIPGHSSAYVPKKKVLWVNLREEPLLYLNGRPIVLREISEPFRNMEVFRGISESRLRDLEWRLKEDVISEAMRCGGSVFIHEEEDENLLTEKWESAPPSAVLTPEEVFFQLRQEGYRVKYERIPCTSGQAPAPSFFNEILRSVTATDRDTWIVFNCQSGNARSTMGVVATYVLQSKRGLISFQGNDDDASTLGESNGRSGEDLASVGTSTPPPPGMGPIPPLARTPCVPDEEKDATSRQLSAGWFIPILQMLRLLVGGGREAKARMDTVIDRCDQITNLRMEVLKFRTKAANSRERALRSMYFSRATVALQRYMLLILWEAYLTERALKEGLRSSSLGIPKTQSVFEDLGGLHSPSPVHGSVPHDLDALGKERPPARKVSHKRALSREQIPPPNVPVTFSIDYRPTFHEWLESRREVVSLLKGVHLNPEHALEGPNLQDINSANYVMDGLSGECRNVMQARRGVMLNTDTILKLDDFENPDDDVQEGTKGARNFRRVPGMRVYGVSTPTIFNAKALIRVIQTSHGAERLLFCNLREEPFVYVNEKPFVLRSVHRPFRNLDAFADIDVKRLEKAEDRMKKEILEEAALYGGKILVHVETSDGSLKVSWEDIEDEDAVQTPKEVFANFSQSEMLPAGYVRVPLTPEREPSLSDIDEILQTVRSIKTRPGTHAVFFCQRGRGRSTFATVLACLELDEFVPSDDAESLNLIRSTSIPSGINPTPASLLDNFPDQESLLAPVPVDGGQATIRTGEVTSMKVPHHDDEQKHGELSSISTDFPAMLSLMRVLKHGNVAKRWLDKTIDRCGAVSNIRKQILILSSEATAARSEEEGRALVESALQELRKYFLLLEVAGYCMETKAQGVTPIPSFKNWCVARPEMLTLKEDIVGRHALRVLAPSEDHSASPKAPDVRQLDAQNADRSFVFHRKGRVLVRGSILKTDHFPGCKRLPDAKIDIDGAPNFRSVWPEGKVDDVDLRVYGTGIPTEPALHEILAHLRSLGGASGNKDPIVWINLREEPILYVNGRPFVLRRLDEPFANLEHTGISRNRVEEMETRFKADVLEEAMANPDHAVLIHEEDDTGGLRGKWERVESVLTPRELFNANHAKADVQYWRIPITDEQSPKPSAFDAIVDIVAATKLNAHLVFNCQMGRGRTTSGLVVASATRLRMQNTLRRFASVVDEKIATNRKFRSKIRNTDDSELPPNVAKELRGEYLAIMAQVRLFDDGPEAKRAMDALIDVCDAMQNLREAIYDVKERSTRVDLSPAVRAEALAVAEHYLKRYAHLVQFTAYLLSCPNLGVKRVKFASWLKSRPELGNALKTLIGDEKKSLLSS